MRINYNAQAMRANNALNVADKSVSASLRRLSSGLKLNSSKDNPSGYAIARRMNTQISGVGIATNNAHTGINIIETADGALTEIHAMLQRMNELAIKGAHGVLTTVDRSMIHEEMRQLKEEIERVARDTEFNGQPLLDGSFDLKGYTNDLGVKVAYYSDDVLSQVYTIDSLEIIYNDDGSINIDKTNNKFVPGEGFPKNVRISEVGDGSVTITDDKGFKITLDIVGENQIVQYDDSKGNLKVIYCGSALKENTYTLGDFNVEYTNGKIDIDKTKTNIEAAMTGFPANVKADVKENGTIEITSDDPDFVLRLQVPSTNEWNSLSIDQTDITYEKDAPLYTNLQLDITGIGAMDMQIGANEGQSLAIRIPTISLRRMGIENTDVSTQENSDKAIAEIRTAILYVSDARSRLGAYQNRLEHTVNSLDVTTENMTSSYSRIMDTDMADEMTLYTTQQVISQAAVSMIAQANERPSQVLQLLQ